jgi:hypothetical protein
VTLRRLASFDAAYQLAVETHRQAIVKLGPKHPETLVCLLAVATISSALDRHDRARPQAQEAARGLRQALGDDHPYTVLAQHNLAAVELRCTNPVVNVAAMERISAAVRALFGDDHWVVPIVDMNKANHLAVGGQFYEARFLDAASEEQLVATFSPRHPDAIAAGINLAIGYEHDGEYAEAEKKMPEAERLAEEVLGPAHPLLSAARDRRRWTYTFVDPPPLV